MLQPRDLRLGNWISVKGKSMQINAIIHTHNQKSDVTTVHKYVSCKYGLTNRQYTLGELTPIPVTQGILQGCGKPWDNTKDAATVINDTLCVLRYDDTQMRVWLNNNYMGILHVQYVHELQNLTFILTSKELEISL